MCLEIWILIQNQIMWFGTTCRFLQDVGTEGIHCQSKHRRQAGEGAGKESRSQVPLGWAANAAQGQGHWGAGQGLRLGCWAVPHDAAVQELWRMFSPEGPTQNQRHWKIEFNLRVNLRTTKCWPCPGRNWGNSVSFIKRGSLLYALFELLEPSKDRTEYRKINYRWEDLCGPGKLQGYILCVSLICYWIWENPMEIT